MSKLTGNVDAAKVMEYAPGELKNLPGFDGGDGNTSTLGGFDAYQIGGSYAKAGVKRIRLHDARHTCGTLMHLEHNVPVGWPPIWTRNTVEPMRTSGTGRDRLDG